MKNQRDGVWVFSFGYSKIQRDTERKKKEHRKKTMKDA